MIIYTDIKRFKIGDGVTPVTQLEFFEVPATPAAQIITWEADD
jgi:hypothetical protein